VRATSRPNLNQPPLPEQDWQQLLKKCAVEVETALKDDQLFNRPSGRLLPAREQVRKNALMAPWCEFAVRAHFWQRTATEEDRGNIHDHRFSFVSYILAGSIENIEWELSDNDGELYNLHHYSPRVARTRYEMTFVRACYAKEIRKSTLPAGSYYLWPCGELHETRVLASPTVTIIVEHSLSITTDPIRVLSNRYPGRNLEIDSPSIALSEMKNYLQLAFEYLRSIR